MSEIENFVGKRTAKQRVKHDAGNVSAKRSVGDVISLFVLCVLLAVTFYSFPLLHNFGIMSRGVQSQNLYAGLAMQHGLNPYNDFFATGGALYYLIVQFGFAISGWVFWAIEVLALFASGWVIYKTALQFEIKQATSSVLALMSVMMIAAGVHGGAQPILFALPFTLWAQRFLYNHFKGKTRDEGFILYGLAAAISFTLAPITAIFWLVGFVALLIFNIKEKRVGRLFYQFFASFLGLILVGYSVAYFALNQQTLYTSIEQSFLLPFFHLTTAHILSNLMKIAIVVFFLGFWMKPLRGFRGKAEILPLTFQIGRILTIVLLLFANHLEPQNLLILLPLSLLFILEHWKESEKWNWLWIVGSVILLIAYPAYEQIRYHNIFGQEETIAAQIQSETSKSDQVLVIGGDKNINLLANRAASTDDVPSNFPVKFDENFDMKVGQAKDKFMVIENGQKRDLALTTILKEKYKTVKIDGISDFAVYERK